MYPRDRFGNALRRSGANVVPFAFGVRAAPGEAARGDDGWQAATRLELARGATWRGGDLSYEVAWRERSHRDWRLSVTLNGTHIRGSPFAVRVLPRAPLSPTR